ncbi:uncharacterized protein Z518_01982 [Rhinocladiella mackenziei CBS 650.93]|uniref:Rhinocladiella mackenziei CBS 650.93 unplaced genomic scaffold supercont1.2, whole genome shotgun sequence n=1 Tax=Rhinocladiella mackenziei CBS 650.93 TaxID=1442369 RepID=A0A0D2INC8_9EURO|nr:uncharacterized protein Z518_01982 [Rhinocladiella mackenziei CBS 650.93]KIX07329.1 hypothetical protein Z518_01982 [Rhinocladiella mackenziei CBS 650.93]
MAEQARKEETERQNVHNQSMRHKPGFSTSSHGQSLLSLLALYIVNPPLSYASTSLYIHPRDITLPLRVTNACNEAIWPAILTQSGTGLAKSGFMLTPGESNSQTVSGDWAGRVWARTNCSFPTSEQGGAACATGDCDMCPECQSAGQAPATLAEFTMSSDTYQAFYDLSLVDGYNIPVGIISLLPQSGNSTLEGIPPNLTNPVCIGTSSLLAPVGDSSNPDFGTNSTFPLPLDQTVTSSFVQNWCPWPLQLDPPEKPGDGVYPYPDDNIQRPIFNPCLSACAKWNKAKYCCTGNHASPSTCSPSMYSTQAKKVCPDAYSYAYDDQTSTFIIPQGGGFEVVFYPSGRSTNILATFGDQLRQLAQTGHATRDMVRIAPNATYIRKKDDAAVPVSEPSPSLIALVVFLLWVCLGDVGAVFS